MMGNMTKETCKLEGDTSEIYKNNTKREEWKSPKKTKTLSAEQNVNQV